MNMLNVKNIISVYDNLPVIRNTSFTIPKGQVVSIVGSNGAGKTTLLKTISGLLQNSEGKILYEDNRIDRLTVHERVELGISQVPEGRLIFDTMSVYENLILGAYTQSDQTIKDSLEKVYTYFPILKERTKQKAGTMSGGQQQMLAIARSLMSKPKLIMFDEPSLGLAPALVSDVFNIIREIKKEGLTIILVEQDVHHALSLADYGYVIQNGIITQGDTGENLLNSEEIKSAYLGF